MAKLPIVILSDAHVEEEAAFNWYRIRSTEAASEFMAELELALIEIQNDPEKWAAHLLGTRRYLLEHFPYHVVYRVANERIEIIAIAHGKRRTSYWARRLKPKE